MIRRQERKRRNLYKIGLFGRGGSEDQERGFREAESRTDRRSSETPACRTARSSRVGPGSSPVLLRDMYKIFDGRTRGRDGGSAILGSLEVGLPRVPSTSRRLLKNVPSACLEEVFLGGSVFLS